MEAAPNINAFLDARQNMREQISKGLVKSICSKIIYLTEHPDGCESFTVDTRDKNIGKEDRIASTATSELRKKIPGIRIEVKHLNGNIYQVTL
jgi:hypothetical protein